MSIMRSTSSPRRRPRVGSPERCARLLGERIHALRLHGGRPLEELAPSAGLTVPEWEAIEAGELPGSWVQVLLIAAALGLGSEWEPRLAKLYAGAQPVQNWAPIPARYRRRKR